MNDTQAEPKKKSKRPRSPNCPAFDLRESIAKTKLLFQRIHRHPVGTDVAITHLGYAPKSSSGVKALAALRGFGLLDDVRADGDQMVKLSARALDLVADYSESDQEWKEAVRAAALSPAIHRELWDRYEGRLPPDDELRRYLVRVRDHKFTDKAVGDFIEEFRSTIDFAGLSGDGKIKVDASDDRNVSGSSLAVGDFVQWTSQGVDQFEKPRQLKQISEDGQWAFVEGSRTGLPMSQLTKADPQKNEPPPNPFFKEDENKNKGLPPSGSKPISLLVGFTDDGEPIYGHVAFDVPLRKGFLSRLSKQLKAMEEGAKDDDE